MEWHHRQSIKAHHSVSDQITTNASSQHTTGSKDANWEHFTKQQTTIEIELISLAQRGNSDAFGELYKLHLDAIYSYIYKRLGEVSEAENLTQTAFLRAWQSLRRYQFSGVPFRAWLYRIAHNAIIDYHRTKKETAPLKSEMLLPDQANLPEDSIVSQERDQMLRQALTKLRPTYQQVLSLRFLNGLDYAETAEVLGRKVNTVRVLQFRALEALHKVLLQEKALTNGKQFKQPTRQIFSQGRNREVQPG